MHDGPNIREIPLRDPEVEGTEGLAGHDPRSVLEIRKPLCASRIHYTSPEPKRQRKESVVLYGFLLLI